MPTKPSRTDKLKASEFFDEIRSIAFGINYFTEEMNNESQSYEMRETSHDLLGIRLAEWAVAKSAIKYITGKTYAFTRTDDCYGIVNEANENDWLYRRTNIALHHDDCIVNDSCPLIGKVHQISAMLEGHQKLSSLVSELSHDHISKSQE